MGNDPHLRHDDEIDLSDLLRNMWATRSIVLAVMIAVTLLYWSAWGAKEILQPTPTAYEQVVSFSFPGIEKHTYPNSTEFRLADVIAPAVLAEVYERNALQDMGIRQAEFNEGFYIEPYAVNRELILAKYTGQLGRKGITPQEIDQLSDKLERELETSAAMAARITFYSEKLMLSEQLAEKVLHDVAFVWATQSVEKRGVLDIDVPLYSDKMFDVARFDSLDFLVAFDLISDKIELLNKNIDTLRALPNGKIVRDDATGYSLFDIQNALFDIRDYEIKQLTSPIKDLGIAKNPAVVKLYYDHKIREMEREKQKLINFAEVTTQTLSEYAAQRGSNSTSNGTASSVSNQYGVSPQLGDDFLGRMIDMTERGSDMQFRQELAKNVIEYREQATEIEHEISQLSEVAQAIAADLVVEADTDKSSSGESALRDFYQQQVREQLPAVLSRLQGLAQATIQVHAKLGRENNGMSGSLYQDIEDGIVSHYKPVSKETIIGYVATMIIAVLLALLGGMLFLGLRGGSTARAELLDIQKDHMVDSRASQARSSAG